MSKPTKITIEIELGNAAFACDNCSDNRNAAFNAAFEEQAEREVARILRNLSERMVRDNTLDVTLPCDINGNRCGSVTLEGGD